MYKQIESNKRRSLFLMVIFIAVIVGLGWIWNQYAGDQSYSILVLAFVIAMTMSLISFFSGDKIALAQSGARQIKKEDNPYVWRMVENLSIASGMPMPKVHIIEDSSMNAFATGRDPEHASIALTTGIINGLENEELEGVIAHELSHIKNYDIRLAMIAIICVGVITLLADWLLRGFVFGRSDDRNKQSGGILVIIGLILAILSPIFARLIQLAVSRKREFLADASGAMMTRYPQGLASALAKISLQNQPLKRANKATAHLYFSNPFKPKNISKLFSTHPPIEERIAILNKM